MATLVLSAAGAALGGSIGGTVLGLSGAVIGKAVGATIGSAIDQKLLGAGSGSVETGRVDNFRVLGAAEGAAVPQVFGQMRTSGQVIWSSRFLEKKSKKKTGSKSNRTTVVSYSYSVSLAVAVCEGEITRIGRVWADGNEISLENITWRLYTGSDTQQPDALIEAVEGAGKVPAYRGTAYIVFENLELGPFGNRIPQFNFEVIRRVKELGAAPLVDPYDTLNAVALIPGTGEYALSTTPVRYNFDKGVSRSANQNTTSGKTDFATSMEQLATDLPRVDAVSLVVSWFGDDLRCGQCNLHPCVEQNDVDGDAIAWRVSDRTRSNAKTISRIDGKSVFGGTACDQSVLEAIAKLKSDGKQVMFYPFVLMDIGPGNTLIDPASGLVGQPHFPWRGRITLDVAPGRAGSPDQTSAAASQVSQFFGNAQAHHFTRNNGTVSYSGPQDWGYRRFILHYAHLCAEAGGIEAFIIGSELRSLTRIRGAQNSFPAVAELKALAADVRGILGPSVKISYAADWSEYFGYRPNDGSGDVWFNLDELWASDDIDFVGIDNYMPLSDWRDSSDHLDAGYHSIYDLDYLTGNVAGGEGYDWYYGSVADREAQTRIPIEDTAHGEDWVFRYKDLKSWWSNPHHNRPGGVRASAATTWVPQSKPIRFTEFGCPAIDKGTNQPNVFVDEKSSEGFVPYNSSGARDDFIQYRYFQAHLNHWALPENNPVSGLYSQPMVDMSHAYIWAFDTRPWPDFPARSDTWSDGANYGRGHWVSGRVGAATLAAVVSQIADRSNFADIDVSELHGSVRGYIVNGAQSARQSLQPLMLSHGFECSELDGKIVFKNRLGATPQTLDEGALVSEKAGGPISYTRTPDLELSSQVQVNFYQVENGFQLGAASAAMPSQSEPTVTTLDVPIALSSSEGSNVAARFLSEAHIARDEASFVLPPSMLHLTVGDIVTFGETGASKLFRIDRLEETGARTCHAVRVEHGVYQRGGAIERVTQAPGPTLIAPAYIEFLDLPLMTGEELPHSPHIVASGLPWVGDLSVYTSASDTGYILNREITSSATQGTTLGELRRAVPNIWSTAQTLRVRIPSGTLETVSREDVLNGANLAAIRGPGALDWEVFQFQQAVLTDTREYELSGFLRGQLGTDAVMPDVHPTQSDFVVLDGSSVQPDLPLSSRGLSRHYRIGPSSRSYDDPSFAHFVKSFDGVGLRPYSPVHLRARLREGGDIDLSWIRRTRLDGDSWQGTDVPLGEESELYLVRIVKDGAVLRETTVTAPAFAYALVDAQADGAFAPFDFEVAQVSAQFGPGPFERTTFNG